MADEKINYQAIANELRINYQAIANELRINYSTPSYSMSPAEYMVTLGIHELANAIERVGRAQD
jgi:hypothetical protein